MRLEVEDRTTYYLEIDLAKLVEYYPVEWKEFLGDDLNTEEAQREFARDTLSEIGIEDFTLPGDSPWVTSLKKDHDMDVTARS